MKRILILTAFMSGFFFSACNKTKPEKASNLPGDNLDLYAVLDLFKNSKNLEGFEKALNDKSNKVNNLDLNGDGKVDYIKVIDNKDGDDHAITLRAPISKTESQDVAVIEVEKTGDKKANVQIVGDEAVYGKDFVIEPKDKNEESGFVFTTVAVNVWAWPCVTYIYSPAYVVYVSPWDYDYYPTWWDPWEPVAYEVYSPVVLQYHSYYYPVGHPRFEHANEIYIEHRSVSPYVEHHSYYNGGYRNGNPAPQNEGHGRVAPNVAPRGNENNYSPARGNRGGNYTPKAGRMPQPGPHRNPAENNNGGNYRQSNHSGAERNQPSQNRMQDHRQQMPQNNMPHQSPRPQSGMPHQQGGMPHQQGPSGMPHQSPTPNSGMPHQGGGRPR
jgi:hypothetical protein